jgi:hypothetical protein
MPYFFCNFQLERTINNFFAIMHDQYSKGQYCFDIINNFVTSNATYEND